MYRPMKRYPLAKWEMGGGQDLTMLDPEIYSDDYHALGKNLGTIGDFLE